MPESPPNESDLVGNQRRTLSMRSELIYWTNQHIESETTINFRYYWMYRSNGWMAFQVNTTCIEINYRLMGMEAEHFFSWVKLNSHENWSHSHSLMLLLSFFRKPVSIVSPLSMKMEQNVDDCERIRSWTNWMEILYQLKRVAKFRSAHLILFASRI